MSLSAPFIHRPVATTLLTIAVALAGALAYLLAAGLAAAAGRFPDHLGVGRAARREPRDHGLGRGHAAGAAVRADRRRHRDDLDQLPGLDAASRMQFDLNRNIDAAARDVQAAINAARGQSADQPAQQSDLPQGQSGRRADHDPGADLRHLRPRPQMYDAASTILQQKLSQVNGVGQVIVGGGALPAVRVDVNPTLLNNYGLGLEDVRTVLATANANRPKGADRRRSDRTWSISTTDQLLKADGVPAADRRLSQRRAGAAGRRGRR